MNAIVKREAMYERIEKHGRTLLRLFPDCIEPDPIKLCKKLRRIEIAANAHAVRRCNGDLDEDAWEQVATRHMGNVCRILGVETDGNVPIFINGDPRGYALKLHAEWTAKHAPDLHRDWGGYGIIAPDLREGN